VRDAIAYLCLHSMPVLQAGPMGSVVTEREHLETVTKPAIVEGMQIF
jgi:hypothetical protein